MVKMRLITAIHSFEERDAFAAQDDEQLPSADFSGRQFEAFVVKPGLDDIQSCATYFSSYRSPGHRKA
jgi:hypothetical protein